MLSSEIVYVVDDDLSIREAISCFFRAHQIHIQTFCSAKEYLDRRDDAPSRCLILDVRMPEQDGFSLQELLNSERDAPPIIFMTGQGDVPSTVKAMKAGAIEVLTKPVDLQSLLHTVRQAFSKDGRTRVRRSEMKDLKERFERLTARGREVLPLVIGGFLNKQAAGILGIAEVTLQVHRAQIMRKMEATSLPDLVRMSAKLGVRHAVERRPSVPAASLFNRSYATLA